MGSQLHKHALNRGNRAKAKLKRPPQNQRKPSVEVRALRSAVLAIYVQNLDGSEQF